MPGLRPVLDALEPVSRRFAAAGHDLYLVGGIVRDQVLGLPVTGDIDLTSGALPGETLGLIGDLAESIWSQGERFGTIGARIAGLDIEITTFRSESYDPQSRKPLVAFGNELSTDLARRDFTINAMAASVHDGRLIDPFNGVGDLRACVLRTPLDPDISFTDDPLRLLRAARLLARFGLTASEDLSTAALRNADRMAIVSAERLRDEFERLLDTDAPITGLQFLVEHDLSRFLTPSPLSRDVIDRVSSHLVPGSSSIERTLVRRAGFFFDLGAEGTRRQLSLLRYSRADITRTAAVVELAPRMTDPTPRARELRRLVSDSGPTNEPELLDAAAELAVLLGTGDPMAFHRALLELRQAEDLTDLAAPINGRRIIRELGIPAGPAVGRIVEELREYRIENGPYDEATAVVLLASVAARLGLDRSDR